MSKPVRVQQEWEVLQVMRSFYN